MHDSPNTSLLAASHGHQHLDTFYAVVSSPKLEELRSFRQLLRSASSPSETHGQAQLHSFHGSGYAPLFTRYDEYLAMVKDFLRL